MERVGAIAGSPQPGGSGSPDHRQQPSTGGTPTDKPQPQKPETPAQFFKRVKAEIAALGTEARALAGPDHGYDYAAAVDVLVNLTDEQARVWAENPLPEKELRRELTDQRDRMSNLRQKIEPLYRKHKFNDPRLPVWIKQLLELKPDDGEMRDLLNELPPLDEPPANPKPGDPFTLRVVVPESEHRAGRILTLPIPEPRNDVPRAGSILTLPIPEPRNDVPRAGNMMALKWKPVSARQNPNK